MTKIGFIGLGIMGKPMALRLHAAGVPLCVYARRAERRAEMMQSGVAVADTPQRLAQNADVVFLMVSDTQAVSEVLFAPTGIAPVLKRGAIVVDMSTIDPLETRTMAEKLRLHDVQMLDAPVSGGEKGAIDGTLSIMVGGDAVALERVQPLLAHLGKNIVHVGDSGAGQVAKACNQLIVAQSLTAMAEAFSLARCAGVDPARVRAALLGGFGYSRALEVHGQRMLTADYTPGFKTALHVKDLHIVLDAARQLGAALPGTALSTQWLNRANQRDPNADSSSVYDVIAALNTPPSSSA